MSGKPKEASVSIIVIIVTHVSRALTVCQALSPELYTLTHLILTETLGDRLLLSCHFVGRVQRW